MLLLLVLRLFCLSFVGMYRSQFFTKYGYQVIRRFFAESRYRVPCV